MSQRGVMTATGDTVCGYHLFDTTIGTCGVVWSARGLLRVQLPERDRRSTERRLAASARAALEPSLAGSIAEAVVLLRRYFAGERVDLTRVVLDLPERGELVARIYAATRAVPWGSTATYGEIARVVGAPGAAQAVGQAMGRNPCPVIIPCHRVLASGDRIGGFSAYGGAITKKRLLALEGVYPGSGTPPLPGLHD